MAKFILRHQVHTISLLILFAASFVIVGGFSNEAVSSGVPSDIQAVFKSPRYKNSIWGLRVVDLDSGKVLINRNPTYDFFIGSVRKVFTIGELLNKVGPNHTYDTPVYREGRVNRAGVLHGNLVLVASGDLTMGGRTRPDGSIAIATYDHTYADALGNAQLTEPDPLAGYGALARQVAASGIKEVTGNVIIDDRLFRPFNFRDEFDVRPIFVNDDMVDLTIKPTTVGKSASVVERPKSAALRIRDDLVTGAPGSKYTLKLEPEAPTCIGHPGCTAKIAGSLPANFVPPLTDEFPLVQTFTIAQPSNYARTVFIEALEKAGVKVDAAPVADNPVRLLPARNSYSPKDKVALLKGLPESDDAKLVLKVSYNIGADTSLVLFGLTHGVDNMSDSLRVERKILTSRYGIPGKEFFFVDGSGGGLTRATCPAVTKMLADMAASPAFQSYYDAMPILGVDGSLGFVNDFRSNPTLAGAKARIHAKTGTFLLHSGAGFLLRGQALGGYIKTRGGKLLAFELVVNRVRLKHVTDVLHVFQDQGKISAMLWRDY